MLLRKIDGKKNVQHFRFSWKIAKGDGGDMLHDWRQRQLSRTRANVFRRDDTLPTSETLPATTDNPNGPSKFRKYRVYLLLLRLHYRDCCSAADGSCRAPAPSYFEEITCCLCQKLHWEWPGNPNDRSKFRNLGLFTFTRSQLMLRRQLWGWWWLPTIAQTARSQRQKTSLGWSGSIEIPQIRKFMPTRSSKTSQKTSFCCYERRHDWRHYALFFSCYHSQPLLFLHSKNNFSTTLTPTEKSRYTYCSFLEILFITKP